MMIRERANRTSELTKRTTTGLTLVELMVTLVIGLFLVIGATTLYVNSRKTADVDDAAARLQEVARYAMSVIEKDARIANYWGLVKDGHSIVNKPSQTGSNSVALVTGTDAADCGANHAIDVERHLDGTNNSYGFPGTCAPSVGTASTVADTLTVRHSNTAISAPAQNRLQICSTRIHASIVRNTTCAGGANRDLSVNTYYVSNASSIAADIPSLRRKTLGAASATEPGFNDVEIIPGVEDMQIQFGWEPGTTGIATSYLNPGHASLAAGQIVAVRVWLLVRAETPDGSFVDRKTYNYADRVAYAPNDNFRRLLVSRTFFIRNSVGT